MLHKSSQHQQLRLGIIGYPIKHTLSPVLHSELMRFTGLVGEYLPYETPAEMLPQLIARFGEDGGRGLNVTIPHKVTVTSQLDWTSPEASMMGAVNTLVFSPPHDEHSGNIRQRPFHVAGHNTDITGFVRSLPPDVIDELPQAHVAILGAGGSARAVLAGLISQKTRIITVLARQPEKAEALCQLGESMKSFYGADTILHVDILEHDADVTISVDGVVNTTPVGMWPNTDDSPLSHETLAAMFSESKLNQPFVYDLIYRPTNTALMQYAADITTYTGQSLYIANGLDMLILQGVAAFELWTGMNLSDALDLPGLRQLLLAPAEH